MKLEILSAWIITTLSFLSAARATSDGGIVGEEKSNIYFSLMVSSAPTLDTTGVVPAVNKVLDAINSDSTILPGYRLEYSTVLDTQCNRTRATELYKDAVTTPLNKTVVAVVGCGCSSACEAVAMASNGTLPVISFSSTSVALSNRLLFPGFFRTTPSDESLPPALTTLMQYYGWRQLSIITETETQFLHLLPLLNQSLTSTGISVRHTFITTSNLTESVTSLKDESSRIFYLNTNPRQALFYMCKAYQEGRHYPEYIWITPGWYQQGWWNDDEDYLVSLNCSSATIQEQLDRSLSLLPHPDTVQCESSNINQTVSAASYALDAVMTLALALNESGFTAPHFNQSLVDAIETAMSSRASVDNQVVFLRQFRLTSIIKLTSPNLNYVIILGALLLMVGNVFVPSPSQNLPLLAVFCTISRIFLSVGYDICFVVALVKTIRVAYIFWNVSPVKKKVKDWQLLLLATGIIMIEIIYTIPLLAVIYVNGDTSVVINENSPPFVNEQGYTVVNRMIICGNSSIQYIIYVALSVSFKLVIHITGLVLAFLTRKVKIDPLNDSRYSAILIYFSCVFLVVAIVIFFLVEDNNLYAGIWTSFVLIEVCAFLGLNFVPKMVSLYKDPQGEKIFGDSETMSKSQFTASATVTDNVNETHFSAIAAEARE